MEPAAYTKHLQALNGQLGQPDHSSCQNQAMTTATQVMAMPDSETNLQTDKIKHITYWFLILTA
jgi:hypothetical protein